MPAERNDTKPDKRLADARSKIDELEDEVRALRLALDVTGSIDQRTGMPNRNALIDAIEERRGWLARDNDPYGVMLVLLPSNIDGPHVGALVHAVLRGVDRVASWGEWVFGAVLPGLVEDDLDGIASRVRRSLELARVTPDRVVSGFSADYPADQMLRAMVSNADIAPGTVIVDV